MKKETARIAYLDLLRIISCFLVIVNHTSNIIFLHIPTTRLWFVSLTYFFLSKVAVPIFIMISGYTLLSKNDSYKKTFIRFIRIVAVIVLFSFLYYINNVLTQDLAFSITDFLKMIFSKHITNAFWYLYLYAALLLMMPFLQKLARAMKKQDLQVYFALSLFFSGFWPIVVHFYPDAKFSSYFSLPLYGSYICMLFLGYYLSKYSEPRLWKGLVCIAAFVLITALNVFLTYQEYLQNSGENYFFYDNRTLINIIVPSFCVFYLVRFLHFGPKSEAVISFLGKYTFGIYLLSDFFKDKLFFIYQNCLLIMHAIPAMLIYEFAIFFTALAVTIVLRQLPLLRKLL